MAPNTPALEASRNKINLRPPLLLSNPSVSNSEDIPAHTHVVRFRHPGYSRQNILFCLYGFDTPDGGLHHETARLACAIVAGNRFDGYLSTCAYGKPIDDGPEDCLMGDDYFFNMPSQCIQATSPAPPSQATLLNNHSSPALPSFLPPILSSPAAEPYPVVPCFQEWEFPHGGLPGSWAVPTTNVAKEPLRSTSDAVAMRDRSCRVTDYMEECDVAHICPEKERDWFLRNEMDRYTTRMGRTPQPIDDPTNLLLLRADVHRAFDKRHFVFLPKIKGVWSTHVLSDSQQHRTFYHNRELHKTAISPQYLFARFAWAIFPLLAQFLDRQCPRRVKLAANEDATWETASRCSELAKPRPRPKNASPEKGGSRSKRQRPDDTNVTEGEELGSETDDCKNAEEQERQPKRRRVAATTSISSGTNSSCPTDYCQSLLSELSPDTTVTEKEHTSTDVSRVRDELLEKERARSDPEGTWEAEQKWVRSVLDNGGALDSSEYDRFWDAMGQEIIPDPGEG